MVTDPYSWAKDFSRTQNVIAGQDRQSAEAYRAAIIEAQMGSIKAKEADGLQRGRQKYASDLDMQNYVDKQPIENAQRRYNTEQDLDAYEQKLGMQGELKNPREVSAESLIGEFEGFREEPYWDVNHHRVGYGSDTTTDADGRVSKTTPNSRVSREDGDRDLSRRVQQFQQAAEKKLGADTWGLLPNNAKAAISSVAYNYGEVPDRIVKAAQSGNLDALANAVEGLGSDDKGVNKKRRRKEAALIRSALKVTAGVAQDNNAPADIEPEAAEYFTKMGVKPIRQVKMSAGQIELLPPAMKKQFIPNPFGQPDRYGNVPYVMVEPLAQKPIAGTDGVVVDKPTDGSAVDDSALDLSELDIQ